MFQNVVVNDRNEQPSNPDHISLWPQTPNLQSLADPPEPKSDETQKEVYTKLYSTDPQTGVTRVLPLLQDAQQIVPVVASSQAVVDQIPSFVEQSPSPPDSPNRLRFSRNETTVQSPPPDSAGPSNSSMDLIPSIASLTSESSSKQSVPIKKDDEGKSFSLKTKAQFSIPQGDDSDADADTDDEVDVNNAHNAPNAPPDKPCSYQGSSCASSSRHSATVEERPPAEHEKDEPMPPDDSPGDSKPDSKPESSAEPLPQPSQTFRVLRGPDPNFRASRSDDEKRLAEARSSRTNAAVQLWNDISGPSGSLANLHLEDKPEKNGGPSYNLRTSKRRIEFDEESEVDDDQDEDMEGVSDSPRPLSSAAKGHSRSSSGTGTKRSRVDDKEKSRKKKRKSGRYKCTVEGCNETFTRKNDVQRHLRNAAVHRELNRQNSEVDSDRKCQFCGTDLSRPDAKARHERAGACGKRSMQKKNGKGKVQE